MKAEEIFESAVVLIVGLVLLSAFLNLNTEFLGDIGPWILVVGFLLAIAVAIGRATT